MEAIKNDAMKLYNQIMKAPEEKEGIENYFPREEYIGLPKQKQYLKISNTGNVWLKEAKDSFVWILCTIAINQAAKCHQT